MANVYEGMFLLDANKYSRDPGAVSGQVVEAIEKCGGDVLVSRLWSEQKLAYQIGKHRKGAYWLTYFRMDGDRLTELKRATQLNNNVIRDLVLAVDDRLVDALVDHAKGTAKAEPAATKPPKADAPKADAPKADAPKADAPKADEAKAEAEAPAAEAKADDAAKEGEKSDS